MRRFFVVFFAVVMLWACGKPGLEPGTKDLDLSLSSVDGSAVRLSDFPDQVILIEFWVTWCGSCQMMVPVLSRLHGKYSDEGLVILGVSMDEGGPEALMPTVRDSNIPYRVLLGDKKAAGIFGEVTGFPTLVIIDREGRLAKKFMGFHSFQELEEQVKRYL